MCHMRTHSCEIPAAIGRDISHWSRISRPLVVSILMLLAYSSSGCGRVAQWHEKRTRGPTLLPAWEPQYSIDKDGKLVPIPRLPLREKEAQ